MATISFVLEKARHASELTPSEIKMIVDELDRLADRLAACVRSRARQLCRCRGLRWTSASGGQSAQRAGAHRAVRHHDRRERGVRG